MRGLLGVADNDTTDLAFVEPLIPFLADLSERAEPAVFEHYCALYSPVILRAVREAPASSFGYDALSKMPALVARIREIAAESITPEIDARLAKLRERLGFYERLLAGEETEEFARLRAGTGDGEARFVTVFSGQGAGLDRGLGKVVTAKGRIEVTGEWSMFGRFDPIVAFEGRTLRPKDPFDEQIGTAVAFAEEHFGRLLRTGELARLPREYRFALSNEGSSSKLQSRFTGGSAGLAFALLSLAAIDSLGVRRERRLVRSDAVFTGTIDREGAVRAVDNETLRAKVRSTFLSTSSRLVLPKENLAAAEARLAEIKESHPERAFELVPVAHVLDAYDDERVVERKKHSAARVIASKARRRKKHLILAASCLVTLVTLLLLLPPRLAEEIVRYRLENGRIYFENKYGYNFGHYDFGYRIFDVPPEGNPAITQSRAYEFFRGDVDGDGSDELLVATVESDSTEINPCGRLHVHVFANDGELMMQTAWLDSLVHGNGGERQSFRKFYYCRGEMLDLDGDGRKDRFAFSLTDREWYPGVVGLVSFADGRVQTFAHVGYIPQFVTGDFDLDGREEIVAAGTSNGLDAAVIAVLDPARMNGSSPDAYKWRFEHLESDVAKYYIRLPKSALCAVPEMDVSRPDVGRINVNENGTVEFAALEKDLALIFYFDSSWRCVAVVPHDSYRNKYELYREKYRLPDLESHIEGLKDLVEYWTGDGWTRTPTINESYLKNLSAKSDTT